MSTRRTFLAAAALGARAAARQPRTVLLRSGWQTNNIGDITHTPGLLRLLDRHLPDAQVILWPVLIDRGAEPMLQRAFPRLRIVRGAIGPNGQPDNPDLAAAFHEAGLFLYGSADHVGYSANMAAYQKITGRPYGCFGVTIKVEDADDRPLRTVLDGADFVFTRETASLTNARNMHLPKPKLAFAPDGTFSFDIRDDARADAYLRAEGLEPGKFIAAIPRLRYTPYHQWAKVPWSEQESARRDTVNLSHANSDHANVREAIIAWVRKTGGKAFLCPEMVYQLDLITPYLYDPLPADVKPHVVRRTTYWLPDEAASIYRAAAAVVSIECHSPIIAAAQGTPCIYLHQPEDSIKGQMWPDIGLSDWYFQIEKTTPDQVAARVLEIAARPDAARRKVRHAVDYARRAQAAGMRTVRATLDAQGA
jgi:hypothetical protein